MEREPPFSLEPEGGIHGEGESVPHTFQIRKKTKPTAQHSWDRSDGQKPAAAGGRRSVRAAWHRPARGWKNKGGGLLGLPATGLQWRGHSCGR